jgi:hypothetical protein
MCAGRWAQAAGLSAHRVTRAQAAWLLAEWRQLMWAPGVRGALWRDVRALFTHHGLPACSAAAWLAQQASGLAKEDAIGPREQFDVLQVPNQAPLGPLACKSNSAGQTLVRPPVLRAVRMRWRGWRAPEQAPRPPPPPRN